MSIWGVHKSAEAAFFSLLGSKPFLHALLLEGPEGVGKATLATQFAAAYLCKNRTAGGACAACPACRKVLAGTHPDVHLTRPGGGSRGFHLEYVRGIRGAAQIRPNEADCKVFILCDAHTMPAGAQNALLKLIEEPPPATAFILTTTSRAAMLGTILSRVQVVGVPPLPVDKTEEVLGKLFPTLPPQQVTEAAVASRGLLGVGVAQLSGQGSPLAERVQACINLLKTGQQYGLMVLLAGLEKKRDELAAFTTLLLEVLLQSSHEFGAYKTSLGFTAIQTVKMIEAVQDIKRVIDQNGNTTLAATLLTAELLAAVQ